MEEFVQEHGGVVAALVILAVSWLAVLILEQVLVKIGCYFENKAYKSPNYLDNLRLLKEFLEKIDSLSNYVNWVERQQIENAYSSAGAFFRNKTRYYKKEPDIKKFNEIYQNFNKFIIHHNYSFRLRQKEKLKSFFDNIENKKLDEQQRDAIVIDEYSNLVIAGAGSGKTLTIIGKVKYLIEDRKIKPEEILLLSFTNQTVRELNERLKKLGISPIARSFHKLGYDIIKNNMPIDKKPPAVTNENALLNVIIDYLNTDVSKDEKISNAYLEYLGCYMNIPKEMDEFESLGDKIENEKGIDLETLQSKCDIKNTPNKNNLNTIQGEKVKSVEELTIANFLFLHGIKYRYEKQYPHTDYNYQPDFYLTEYNIYIEHFGVDKSNRARWLNKFKEKEYVESMFKKKELHKKNKTKLISTYSYFNKENLLKDNLQKLLIENGVKFKAVNVEKVYEKIKQNDKNFGSELNRLICSFITLCKSGDLDRPSIEKLFKRGSINQNSFLNERQSLFLNFALPILDKYNSVLKKEGEIDFNDMINEATKTIISNKAGFDYKYIIVDEYQDVSRSRFNLIKAIRDVSNSTIMCVGDDWQSIYRFAGSDISLFSDFEEHFGKSAKLLIEKTYRNSQNLIDISKKFILKNSNQIVKHPKSEKENIPAPIKYVYYDDNLEEEFIKQIKLIEIKSGKKPILVLGRHFHDLEDLISKSENNRIRYDKRTNKIKVTEFPDLEINFLTVHRSKGVEAENVIVLNLKNDTTGFPNKLSDDMILEPLLSKPEAYSYAEERRLFYVALTRTKNKVVLMINNSNESLFVNELIKDNNETVNRGPKHRAVNCPYCKKGTLEVRTNKLKNTNFLGCSNYPVCPETINDISVLQNSTVCPRCKSGFVIKRESARGKFWGCTNYPNCKMKSKKALV